MSVLSFNILANLAIQGTIPQCYNKRGIFWESVLCAQNVWGEYFIQRASANWDVFL